MKVLKAIVSAVVVGSAIPLISSDPAVAGCYPATAANDYGDMLAAGTSPNKAMGVVQRDNYDGTEDCRIKFNMHFYRKHRIKPFSNVRRTPTNKSTTASFEGVSDTGPCWDFIVAHKPTGDAKVCIN